MNLKIGDDVTVMWDGKPAAGRVESVLTYEPRFLVALTSGERAWFPTSSILSKDVVTPNGWRLPLAE